jgi:hypothetical protein
MKNAFIRAMLVMPVALRLAAAAGSDSAADAWPTASVETAQAFVAAAKKHIAATESPTIRGADGWLFSRPELRHLTVGPFWGEAARAVSTAENEEWRDPIPAIVQFHNDLKALGVELLLVPVPPKAALYADKLCEAVTADADGRLPRVDTQHQAFYQALREQGVQVMDLTPVMLNLRRARAGDAAKPEANCQTDTHWSPGAIEAVSAELARWIAGRPWHDAAAPRIEYASRRADLTITGDLTVFLPADERPGRETFPGVRFVGRPDAPDRPVEASLKSPILLLGDSHTLVFSFGGEMHCTGAGLPDQLAFETGGPIDLLGIMGSGASPTRMTLFRRAREAGYIEGKKLVIWCFRGMEFTENPGGWRPLPVKR